ncbi:MAG: hypothetical protein H0V17_25990 [Deltaproteobacteria bacterium]|nr:hypothetical protein [Deltaproteobacteria bacterium]
MGTLSEHGRPPTADLESQRGHRVSHARLDGHVKQAFSLDVDTTFKHHNP